MIKSYISKIKYKIDVIREKDSDFQFLHCVTKYPTQLNQLHLSRMNKLRKYTKNIGFSDHTKTSETGLVASKITLSLGATCIERHFTVLDEGKTKDGPVSISPEHLKELCDFANYDTTKQKELIKTEFSLLEFSLGN